jgi:hypothetical protein
MAQCAQLTVILNANEINTPISKPRKRVTSNLSMHSIVNKCIPVLRQEIYEGVSNLWELVEFIRDVLARMLIARSNSSLLCLIKSLPS